MDKKILMCDSQSLTWCGRISLLLTFCIVLCTMMFQIWSYYFSLVSQMDTLVVESQKCPVSFIIVTDKWSRHGT